MIINGIEFDFSTLNANDVDRMLAAQTRQQERARTEGSRYTPENDYPAWLRFQCLPCGYHRRQRHPHPDYCRNAEPQP